MEMLSIVHVRYGWILLIDQLQVEDVIPGADSCVEILVEESRQRSPCSLPEFSD